MGPAGPAGASGVQEWRKVSGGRRFFTWGSIRTADIECPEGWKAVGGSFEATTFNDHPVNDVVLVQSYASNERTWSMRLKSTRLVFDTAGDDLEVHAICVR